MALSRDTRRPLYEIEGLVSFYPHFRTEPPRGATSTSATTCPAGCAVASAASTRCGPATPRTPSRGRRGVLPRAAATSPPPWRSNEQPAAAAATADLVADRPGRHPRADRGSTARAGRPRRALAERPVRAPARSATGCCAALLRGDRDHGLVVDAEGRRSAGHGRRRFPDRPQVGRWSRRSRATRSTSSATPTSPSPGRSRTARSWPTSRTSCSRGCCSACVVVGAEEGWVFIRHEYGPEEAVLRDEIEPLRRQGLVGADVDGRGRRLAVEVFTSPGGYILGEESALIECMEGHRGEPRNKPPFPGTYGLWGKPDADELGRDARRRAGHRRARRRLVEGPGRRRLDRPEVLRRLRARRSARACTAYRWAPRSASCSSSAGGVRGGAAARRRAAGRCVVQLPRPRPPRRAARLRRPSPRPGSMLGSGAMVVMAEGTDLLAAATNVLRVLPQRVVRQVRALPGRARPRRTPCSPTCWPRAADRTTAARVGSSSGDGARRPRSAASARWRSGPVVSVLGTIAAVRRPAPAAELGPGGHAGARVLHRPDGRGGPGRVPARAAHGGRGGRPGRRAGAGSRPRRRRAAPPCPASRGRPSTASPSGPPTRTASPTASPAT